MLYYPPNARTQAQRRNMEELEAAGICIFCPEHFDTPVGKQILLSNDTWSVAHNDYPYDGAAQHLLLIPHEHVTRKTELSPAAKAGYWDILDQVEQAFDLTYFGLGCRNGGFFVFD
jgi:ATP adenylyltransferase